MDKYYLWEIMSYSWTEVGISDEEYRDLAKKARITPAMLGEVDRIIFRDIALAFALESWFIIPPLWVLLPDWGFSEEFIRKRMQRWYSVPYAFHVLNPFRIVAFPVSVLFLLSGRSKLRAAVRENARA